MSNYHKIKAIINSTHNYSEVVHGITEGVLSLFRMNVIKIKSIAEDFIIMLLKPKENTVEIKNSTVNTSLWIKTSLEHSVTKIINDLTTYAIMFTSLNSSNLKIINSVATLLLFILHGEGISEIQNTFEHFLSITVNPQETICCTENDEIDISLNLLSNPTEQIISIDNPNVNASAWYFTKLEAMSGSLNAYYNQTIEDTGRKKVV